MSHPIHIYFTDIQEGNCENIQGKFLESCLFDRYKIRDARVYYNEHGKPLLKDYPEIHFNGSHSHNIMSIAFSENCLLGLDVEWIRDLPDEREVAREFFSENEYRSYRSQENAFYQFWTAKEACAKAFGWGLSAGDKLPEVIEEGGRLVLKKHSKVLDAWSVMPLGLDPAYSACLVVNKRSIKLNIQRINTFGM